MSIKTWKDEFYPVELGKKMTKITAIKHSLQKWIGLRPENLKKHDVTNMGRAITGFDGGFFIDGNSCALCAKYYYSNLDDNEDYDEDAHDCAACPLYKSLGNACDEDETYPFQVWVDTGNPEPMISALEKLLG